MATTHYKRCPSCYEQTPVNNSCWVGCGGGNIRCIHCNHRFYVSYTEEDRKIDIEDFQRELQELKKRVLSQKKGG